MSSRTCLITADECLLSAAMMMELFRPSQKWDLHGVVAVLASKVNFKGLHHKIVSQLLNASRHMKNMHAVKTQTVI